MKATSFDQEAGARVRALRQGRSMTQADLGQEIGVTYQQIQKYEAGINQMSAAIVSKMAQVLLTTPNRILGFKSQQDGAADKVFCRIEGMREPARTNLIAGFSSMIDAVEGVRLT